MVRKGDSMRLWNRRWLALGLLLLIVLQNHSLAQEPLRQEDLRVFGPPLDKTHQELLFHYFLAQAKQATEKRLARLETIRSEADFKNWQETNRRKFLELIGELPEGRTALSPHTVGEFVRDGYLVRKVIFESLPS
ncbi:MAG: hypothetical protein DMG05_15020, partial [Acidobacteria bacterium]